jgi:hypothetical protein
MRQILMFWARGESCAKFSCFGHVANHAPNSPGLR